MSPCPTKNRLESLLADSLDPNERPAIEAHVEACPACQQILEQLTTSTLLPAKEFSPPKIPFLDAVATLILNGSRPVRSEFGELPSLPGYEVLGVLGHGGGGIVYRARQVSLGRPVALKMILSGRFAAPRERARFLTEAAAIARLQHPHIVQVFEVGEHDGLPFFSLELCEAGSLADRLRGMPLGARAAAELTETLTRAAHYAHVHGIIHRDLKPANILLQWKTQPPADGKFQLSDCEPKVADFGVAKQLDAEAAAHTSTGAIVGSPSYMAPEQAQARSADINVATDVYALGAILYELLTGRPPFRAETPLETMEQVVHHEPAPPRQLQPGTPRDLETICLKCLRKESIQRYQSAQDLADDLRRWLNGEPIHARPVGPVERLWRWGRRNPRVALMAVALLLVSVLGLAGVLWQWHDAVDARNVTEGEKLKAVGLAGDLRVERDTARRMTYRAEIAAASAALRLNDLGGARAALARAPEAYRGWEWQHLSSRLDGARTVLRGHERDIRFVAVSRDGKRLATQDTATIRIWDVTSGTQVVVLRGQFAKDITPAFSAEGRLLYLLASGIVRLWDGNQETTLPSRRGAQVRRFALDPGGRRAALMWDDRTLTVWDLEAGRAVATVACDTDPSVAAPLVALSPDGRHIAYSAAGHSIRVVDLTTGKETAALRGHVDRICALAYNPDGTRLASGALYPDKTVRLWNPLTGESVATLTGHTNQVDEVAFNQDGTLLASCSPDQTARLWDGRSGEPRATLRGHTGRVAQIQFNPAGTRLVSASLDHTLRMWNVSDGELVAVLFGHEAGVEAVAFAADGAVVVSGSDDRTVRFWDTALVERNGVLRGHQSYVYDVAFHPDGEHVASSAWDGTVRLWEATTGREVGRFQHDTNVVQSVAFGPRGDTLVSVDHGLTRATGALKVSVWDVQGERRRLSLDVPGGVYGRSRAVLDPAGTLLATGNDDGVVRLWDAATGEVAGVLSGHDGNVLDVAFSPDGKILASTGDDGSVRLWDVKARKALDVLRGHESGVNRLAWNADGSLLASAGDDGKVLFWDGKTGERLAELRHGSKVYGLSFSPDGRRLATGCADNTIRLWDVAARDEVATLHGHTDYVHAVAFSPDGTRLASVSGDATVRIWDTIPIVSRASDNCSPEETLLGGSSRAVIDSHTASLSR